MELHSLQVGILSLCYDSVKVISNKYCVVWKAQFCGVVDGDTLTEVIPLKYSDAVVIGEHLLLREINMVYRSYNLSTLCLEDNLFNQIEITGIREFDAPNAWIAFSNTGKGIINKNFDFILPPIYSYIYRGNKYIDRVEIKAFASQVFQKLYGFSNWYDPAMSKGSKMSKQERELMRIRTAGPIIANADYTSIDCYGASTTPCDKLQIVISSVDIEYKKTYQRAAVTDNNTMMLRALVSNGGVEIKPKFRLRYSGRLVGEEVDLIVDSCLEFHNFNCVKTYIRHPDGSLTTGLETMQGDTLIRPDKYELVSYIGNGIFGVLKNGKCGIVANNIEVVECGDINNLSTMCGVPIRVAVHDNKWMFIGNDGRLYDRVELAFPIFKSKVDSNVNYMNLYGYEVAFDNKFKLLDNIPDECKVENGWINWRDCVDY